jgi:hypothetical protein
LRRRRFRRGRRTADAIAAGLGMLRVRGDSLTQTVIAEYRHERTATASSAFVLDSYALLAYLNAEAFGRWPSVSSPSVLIGAGLVPARYLRACPAPSPLTAST